MVGSGSFLIREKNRRDGLNIDLIDRGDPAPMVTAETGVFCSENGEFGAAKLLPIFVGLLNDEVVKLSGGGMDPLEIRSETRRLECEFLSVVRDRNSGLERDVNWS